MRPVNTMEIRHLRYFCALAEELHFTRAAVRLNVAQSALSQQIKQLEEGLGTQLLERAHRRVRLTEAGEVFQARALQILEEMDQAARDAVRVGQGDAGPLAIGVASAAMCGMLPQILRAFHRASPNVQLDIRTLEPDEQVEALRKEAIDFGMVYSPMVDAAFESAPMARERLVIALPAGHRAAAKDRVSLRELAGETFLVPRRRSIPGFHEVTMRALGEGGIAQPRVQFASTMDTTVYLVAGHLGAALVPESFRQHLRVRGCIYRDLAGAPVYADSIGLWRRGEVAPALRRFVQLVKREERIAIA